ncbi:MAG TPA: four helix bundle protein [Candidatus Binatia bacterium]|jgi:four helix bundle protein
MSTSWLANEQEKSSCSRKRFHQQRGFLSDQIRRSSGAVNAMIAEAWVRRRYPAAFVNKIDESLGEAMETQAWLDHAANCDYLNHQQYRELVMRGKKSAQCSIE